jgi:DNA-binding NarL/FixJ family response regulator
MPPSTHPVDVPFDSDETIQRAFRSGASGFVLKTAHPDDLVHAVKVVARGDALVAPSIARRLVERFAATPAQGRPAWAESLTGREAETLRNMARGMSNAEIASHLFVSEATVKTHVTAILGKLGVRDRLQAVVLAYGTGFATPP